MAFFKGRFSAWLTVCGLVVAGALAAFAADCNNNETQDSEDIGSGFSEDCNENGVPDECEGFSVNFKVSAESVPAAATPRVLATGDIDGDQDTDIVVGSRRGSTGR